MREEWLTIPVGKGECGGHRRLGQGGKRASHKDPPLLLLTERASQPGFLLARGSIPIHEYAETILPPHINPAKPC